MFATGDLRVHAARCLPYEWSLAASPDRTSGFELTSMPGRRSPFRYKRAAHSRCALIVRRRVFSLPEEGGCSIHSAMNPISHQVSQDIIFDDRMVA